MTQDDINAIIKALNENEQRKSLEMSYHYHRAQRERYQRKAQKLKEKQKKRQLMRESDFDKLPKELLARYDVTFKPFTRNYFEPAHIEKLINLGDKEYAKNPTGGHWAE